MSREFLNYQLAINLVMMEPFSIYSLRLSEIKVNISYTIYENHNECKYYNLYLLKLFKNVLCNNVHNMSTF